MNIGSNKNTLITLFKVWAPLKQNIELHILSPEDKIIPMEKDKHGYWHTSIENIAGNIKYVYRIDNKFERPDPVSFYQPDGVHGPSQVTDHSEFEWSDSTWKNIPLGQMIFYEIHTGTFTPQGTFDGIIERLNELKEIGINTIEIMPVSQFPGKRNWGYDGVYPFAVQNSYGGPEGLKRLVNSCHNKGMMVCLDVVYNHLGPEGNYIGDFAPYFTDKYKTPWGRAINFDGEYSYDVRQYFIENALYWFKYFHIDALRLDAIHGIFDSSSKHILTELAEKVAEFSVNKGQQFYLIAESDLNDAKIVTDNKINAQWNDDFHHSIHALLTKEKLGYYQDFGSINHLEKCLKENFVLSGQYSKYRNRKHGNSAAGIPGDRFVVYSQNHDQTGNRPSGDRLSTLTDFEGLKLAAGMTILSQFTPLLFMGEEYGETSPFLYFANHGDKYLIESVRNGRNKGFEYFGWKNKAPDPYDESTFDKCILNWNNRKKEYHGTLLKFYKELINLRKSIPVFLNYSRESMRVNVTEEKNIISIHRFENTSEIFIIAHFSSETIMETLTLPDGKWKKQMDSQDPCWLGKKSAIIKNKSNIYEFEFNGFGIVLMEKTRD